MSILEYWPALLTIQETAEILRADLAQVGDLIRAGKINHAEVAGRMLIPRPFLEEFIVKSCKMCYNEGVEISNSTPDSQEAQHLDNCKSSDCTPFQGEIEMAKITRTVTIIRYDNSASGHVVVVTSKTDEYVKVTESGLNNHARWGGQYFKWWLEEQPGYTLYTRYPE